MAPVAPHRAKVEEHEFALAAARLNISSDHGCQPIPAFSPARAAGAKKSKPARKATLGNADHRPKPAEQVFTASIIPQKRPRRSQETPHFPASPNHGSRRFLQTQSFIP
jgi:hypothetical protein